VPQCGRSLCLYVLFITDQYKNIGQAILVGKCLHCRINMCIKVISILSVSTIFLMNFLTVLVVQYFWNCSGDVVLLEMFWRCSIFWNCSGDVVLLEMFWRCSIFGTVQVM
jgi:hypothetical protein